MCFESWMQLGLLYRVPLCSALSPQPSYFRSKQKTLVCLGKWTAHIPVKRHIEPVLVSIAKRKKLNSVTNAYLFPILTLSNNTLLLVSQHEAVILLALECMCMPTVEIFFWWETVCCSVQGVSFLVLLCIQYNRKSLGDGIDSPSPLFFLGVYTKTRTPTPPKQSF